MGSKFANQQLAVRIWFKVALSAGLIALTVSAGFAAEWFPIPLGKDADQYYYDRSKLVMSTDEITYWKKVVFKAPQKVKSGKAKSALYRERVHCKEHTQKTLNYTLYAENGTVLESTTSPDAVAEAIQPETVGDQFEKHMCQLLQAKREDAKPAIEEAPPKVDPKRAARLEELERLRTELSRIQMSIRKLEQELGGDTPAPSDANKPLPGEI